MPILQIKDENGKFIPIPAIKGNDGKSAYEQAVEGGYIGTEEAFIAMLNGLTNSEDAAHYSDFNNPHRVTKEQIGLGNVPNVSTNDQAPTYEEATTLETLTSGEKISGAFGKIKKAISEVISHISDKSKHNQATNGGGAVGDLARSVDSGFAGGRSSYAYDGGAVGGDALTSSGFAGGYYARTENDTEGAIDAIQLGTGVNKNERTLQVYGYQLMADNGVIPSERLPIATGDYEGGNTHGANNPLTLTFPFVPKIVFICPNKKTTDVPFAWIYGSPVGLTAYNNGVAYASNLTWEGNTLTWYTSDGYPSYQHNNGSTTYYWVAIG